MIGAQIKILFIEIKFHSSFTFNPEKNMVKITVKPLLKYLTDIKVFWREFAKNE